MDTLVRFLDVAMKLKTLKRAGWVRRGVDPCESVADHTFGVALLALLLPRHGHLSVNRDRCVALALVHDLAESLVGDITPHDGVEAGEKRRLEENAIRELAGTLGDSEIVDLWLEFEAGESAEAKLVRELDAIEMAQQAVTYQRAGKLTSADAQRFIESSRSRVTSDAGVALLKSIADDAAHDASHAV